MFTRVATFLGCLCVTVSVAAQVQIDSIEINQAIGVQKNNARKFVAGKDTVVRALLNAPAAIDAQKTSAKITRDGNVIATLAPATVDGAVSIVDFPCPSRDACGGWAAGSYTFDVTVNGLSKSTAGTDFTFVERGPIRILALPVTANYGGTVVRVTDQRWKMFAEYVRRTYPVAADKLVWVTREDFDASDSSFDLETDDGRLHLWEALTKLIPANCAGTPSAEGCFNQVFGFIMARPMGYPNGRLQGYTYGRPANVGVLTDEDAAATVAHEIGHTFGLGDTYDGGTLACDVNPAPDGYSGRDFSNPSSKVTCMTGRVALDGVSATKIPAEQHPYEIGGRGALPDTAEYMGSGGLQAQYWTTQEAYDWIFDHNTPAPTASERRLHALATPQRFIQCYGSIREAAAMSSDVRMEPCWSFEDTDPIPNTTGPYMIAAIDASGARVATAAIRPQFDPIPPKGMPGQHIDFAPFEAELAFPAATAKFQILFNGNVVKEVPVSAHAPVVTNVAPQLTGSVNGPVTVTWDATDADGDAMTYELVYNADVTNPNSEWQVVQRDLTTRSYRIDFSEMAGGRHAQLAVIATDGVNASEAESLQFEVAVKPPQVFIEPPDNDGVVGLGRDLVLDGDAFDLQDDDIPEASLRWSSNISGPLGAGTPLVLSDLPLGLHTITLSVTNSGGMTGTATVKVLVTTEPKRRAVRR